MVQVSACYRGHGELRTELQSSCKLNDFELVRCICVTCMETKTKLKGYDAITARNSLHYLCINANLIYDLTASTGFIFIVINVA